MAGRGRPKKSDQDRRKNKTVLLSEAEWALLQRAAAVEMSGEKHVSASGFVRRAALARAVEVLGEAELEE